MPVELSFDADRRLLLVTYGLAYDLQGLDQLDKSLGRFIEVEGPVDAIFDLSSVTEAGLPNAQVRVHGRRPTQLPANRRAMIAADPQIYGLLRAYAQHQELIGTTAPTIVRTMPEALAAVGAQDPVFKPWPKG